MSSPYLREALGYYKSEQFFKAARYAFAAKEQDEALEGEAYSWIALSLIRAKLYQSSSYFFIRTLQTGNKQAIQRVLNYSQQLLVHVGPDLLRKYLIQHTNYEDYNAMNRSAYLFSLAKEALLIGNYQKVIGYVNGMDQESPMWPFALQMRASAYAIMGKGEFALEDFKECQERASNYSHYFNDSDDDEIQSRHANEEAEDLESRCIAGLARTYYQMDRFEEAEQTYDRIPKQSLVWPDILFEQAWNAFAKEEYNRTLGKLVSYKSSFLDFVFNPEIDVLRAQTYLALCLYNNANDVINEFNSKYSKTGEEIKSFVENNAQNLSVFYEKGKLVLRGKTTFSKSLESVLSRFVRGPYFQNLVQAEKEILGEKKLVMRFAALQANVQTSSERGFPGFLEKVLDWRLKTVQSLGGAFVKNSLMDHHSALISDFEKMSFIKLEMLKIAKDMLIYKNKNSSNQTNRTVGTKEPDRQDYQYYWSFNGEFWADELGDYVFGLESACRGKNVNH